MNIETRSTRAFTLVEIIVALIILAILSAIAISRYENTNIEEDADNAVIENAIKQTQMRAMSDIPGAGWSIDVNGPSNTINIKKNTSTTNTFSL